MITKNLRVLGEPGGDQPWGWRFGGTLVGNGGEITFHDIDRSLRTDTCTP